MDIISYSKAKKVESQLAQKANKINSFRKWTPKYKETFGTLSRWASAGNCSLADDTRYFSVFGEDKREDGSLVRTNGTSIKMTKTSTTTVHAQADCVLSQPLDISNHHALMKYYIHEGADTTSYTSLTAITLMLYDANGGYAYWSDEGKGGTSNKFFPGWRTTPFRMLDYSTSASFDPKRVVKIRLWFQTFSTHTAYTPSITFDFFEFIPKLKTPIPYVVTFDGTYINQKKALAYLASKGIKAHVYSTFDLLGTPGMMTVEDLKQVEAMGHIVGFHERSAAPTGFYSLTDAEKVTTVQQGIDWMNANGFKQGVGFAPLATQWWSDKDDLNILMPMLEHVRIGQERNQVLWNPRKIGLAYDTNSITVEQERAARQRAIDRGTMYAGCVHGLDTSFTLNDFYTIIDEAYNSEDIVFVTVPELMLTDWYSS